MIAKAKDTRGYLAAISASPYSQYLIKWTGKAASERNCRWLAVYIQTGRELSKEENKFLKQNFNLVSELGGELIVSMDEDIPAGIMRVANQHGMSHIVVGKPLGYRPGFFKKTDIIKTLIRLSGETDIFVISEHSLRPEKSTAYAKIPCSSAAANIRGYLSVSLWLLLLVILNLFLFNYINYLSIGFIFLAAVSIISLLYRRGPVLYFAAISAVLWNFLFLQPRFTFYVDRLEDMFMFLMYFLTAFIIGSLTTKLRLKEAFLRKREKNLEELYRMSSIFNKSGSKEEMIGKSTDLLREIFSIRLALFLKDEGNSLSFKPYPGNDFDLSGDEWEEALHAFESKQSVYGSSASDYYYMPMLTGTIPLGVLVTHTGDANTLTLEQQNLLTALASQITAAIERNEHTVTQQKIKLAEESEKLYQVLLNSVSHELRTPITAISTAANGLIDEVLGEKPEVRKIFAGDIVEASDRLNRIVDNLLGSLRMESGRITLNLDWYDIGELVNAVIKKTSNLLMKHDFSPKIDPDLPAVKFDFKLMEQLLLNLLYNAVMHTPEGSMIRLGVKSDMNDIVISIDDSGPGIPAEEREKIFSKFYRLKNARTGGLGLGLSICKEIAEIHKGMITCRAGRLDGANFTVRLPLQRDETEVNYSE